MPNEQPGSYKPTAIKTASLVLFGIATVVLLVFLVEVTNSSSYYSCGESPSPGEPPATCAPPSTSFTSFDSWTDSQYFIGAYLPTLLAVMYGATWDIIYWRVREMEPFFQLSRHEGVSAEKSLLLHYKSASFPLAIYRSFVNGHLIVALAALITLSLLLAISIPFASEVLHIATSGTCTGSDSGTECDPKLELRVPVARLEIAVIVTTLSAAVFLAIYYARRDSRLRSEASSIAGIATLLQDAPFVEKLHRVSRTQTEADKRALLCENYYILAKEQQGESLKASGQVSIQLRPCKTSKPSSIRYSSLPANHAKTQPNTKSPTPILPRSPFVISRLALYSMGLLLLGLLVLIIYYRIVGTMSGFEKFMTSQSIGVRFMMTSLGVLIKLYWISLEKGE